VASARERLSPYSQSVFPDSDGEGAAIFKVNSPNARSRSASYNNSKRAKSANSASRSPPPGAHYRAHSAGSHGSMDNEPTARRSGNQPQQYSPLHDAPFVVVSPNTMRGRSPNGTVSPQNNIRGRSRSPISTAREGAPTRRLSGGSTKRGGSNGKRGDSAGGRESYSPKSRGGSGSRSPKSRPKSAVYMTAEQRKEKYLRPLSAPGHTRRLMKADE